MPIPAVSMENRWMMNNFSASLANESQSYLERAWACILANQLSKAKTLLANQLLVSDDETAEQWALLAGIVACLEGDYCPAEDHIGTALDHYDAIGQQEESVAIRLYFAYLYRQMGASDLSAYHLLRAMTWLDANHVSVIQHWWHPPIMNAVLDEAIKRDCFPMRARVIQEQSRFYYARTRKKGKVSTRILLCLS